MREYVSQHRNMVHRLVYLMIIIVNSPLKFRHKAKRLSRTAKEFLENVIN